MGREGMFCYSALWEARHLFPFFFLHQHLYHKAIVVVDSFQRFGKCKMVSDMVRERPYNEKLTLILTQYFCLGSLFSSLPGFFYIAE